MYSVKDVAEIFNISVHKVRYYDDCGLIPDVMRDSSKKRIFSDESLEWFFICIILRNTGLSIKNIKNYVELYKKGDSTVKDRLNLMILQKEKVLSEMEDLKMRLEILDKKIEYYSKIIDGEKISWDHDFIQNLIWKEKNKNG